MFQQRIKPREQNALSISVQVSGSKPKSDFDDLLGLVQDTGNHLRDLRTFERTVRDISAPIPSQHMVTASREVGLDPKTPIGKQDINLVASYLNQRMYAETACELNDEIKHYDAVLETAKDAVEKNLDPTVSIAVGMSPEIRTIDRLSNKLSRQVAAAIIGYGTLSLLHSLNAIPSPLQLCAAAIVTGIQIRMFAHTIIGFYQEYKEKAIRDKIVS